MSSLPAFARGLCDDAAMFPPGLLPLQEAVPAHLRHEKAPHADLVGPLVVAVGVLGELRNLLAGQHEQLPLAVTLPAGPEQLGALRELKSSPVRLRAIEVAVPETMTAADLVAALDRGGVPSDVEVFVEVPRDDRRAGVLAALSRTRYKAKFRTGGVKAELHPGEAELASAVRAAVSGGVPFKATAGLHHAIRNTDPRTGFEQHGFLNLLLATDAAVRGAAESELVALLAERDGHRVAGAVSGLGSDRATAARERFLSFGTCSIAEPLTEMIELGLLPGSLANVSTE
ncbi:hypothetical protein E1202_08135 [Saccharopolyspora karakumensis]|uniref:Uncharacterized protein n=1 Tax=Saccharopolyspora karakumensis TaxID=2530386 RepID=A0A4V2YXV5_9PSEU|nr:hypothetical protein [Saccharopolyspora karakumensis]TDD90587.1 hypothetical protein E1202_08135 [Saccharopolyspora karakumensis]